MFIIESKYGNNGYSFWFKLLELLGDSEGHFYDINSSESKEYLTAKTRLEWEECCTILKTLVNLKAIDPELWEKGIIWSDNFIEGIKDVYRNRKQVLPLKPVSSNIKGVNDSRNGVNDVENTQSKVKESKVKDTKVFLSDSDEYRLADLLLKLIREHRPEYKKPNMNKWAYQIDLMIRQDKRKIPEIEKVIRWCQNDSFWHVNILSTAKLREKYDQLQLKMNQKGGYNEQGWIPVKGEDGKYSKFVKTK